ncbi:MAG TPA: VOC family protein [Alteromonas australica]|jgi:predicted lactoylglutathione lyase|uniref:Glyoxalase n=1 Tax=Alteromonas australica TaxID=589873 RepID=A0A075NVP6_9ALTE|nr:MULTISPECIES: VOC family protein [Alteromonas]MAF71015.1 VOC family protein [Alteromonas sp.]AIF97518.1 glyoxalase [Alteromonas australica]AJP42613.1 glyoxalase [Alteromonas australica]MBU35147.1 VOC family protein [Alteromonas sp.]QPL50410.1 VOC family protein [Alteromonas sp. B31-7]|tara:strand:+ start:326 stop:712 length:387 start_codon:yes stop_codon:yes gene_type:complete
MIGYITLGTADLEKAAAFYDALLGTIGATRFMEEPDYFIAWSKDEDQAALSVTKPFDQKPATVGNGVMVAMYFETPEQVNAFYDKAIELGATCEGQPGFRPQDATSGFYAGYFRDLDGNKLNAFCMVE